eukprot:jgi/Mesvir1/7127/Mv09229-RA.1
MTPSALGYQGTFLTANVAWKRASVRPYLAPRPVRASADASSAHTGLERWLSREGVNMEPLEIRSMGSGGRGLFSRRKIKRGETCVTVPGTLPVTMQTVLDHPMLGPLVREHSIPEWAALAMWLVYTTHDTLTAQADALATAPADALLPTPPQHPTNGTSVASASTGGTSDGGHLAAGTRSATGSPWAPYVLELPTRVGTLMEWPQSSFSDPSLLGGATIGSVARQQRSEFDQLISAILDVTSRHAKQCHGGVGLPQATPRSMQGQAPPLPPHATTNNAQPIGTKQSPGVVAINAAAQAPAASTSAGSPPTAGYDLDDVSPSMDQVFTRRRLEWAFSILLSRLVRLAQGPSGAGREGSGTSWFWEGGGNPGRLGSKADGSSVPSASSAGSNANTNAIINAATRVALVPYADLLNHAVESAAYLTWAPAKGGAGNTGASSKGAVVMVADRDYEAGEQVYISYGPLSSGQLLLSYGFVPPLGSNPHDEAWLALRIDEDDPLRQAKLALLETAWGAESDGCQHHEQRFPLRQNEIPGQLMGFARLAASTDDTIVHFTSCTSDPPALAARLQGGIPSLSPPLELAARQLAVKAIKAALAAYTFSPAQDEQRATALPGDASALSVTPLANAPQSNKQTAGRKASKQRKGGQPSGNKRVQASGGPTMQQRSMVETPTSASRDGANTVGGSQGGGFWQVAAGSRAEDLAELARKASVVCMAERRILLRAETILRKEMRDLREGKQLRGARMGGRQADQSMGGSPSSGAEDADGKQGRGILGSVMRMFGG